MRLLTPFFRFADAGSYPLAHASRLRKTRVARAIAKAIDRPVNGIDFVSREMPFERPGWMTEKAYRRSVNDALRTSLGMDIREGLVHGLGEILDPAFREASDPLRHTLSASLGSRLLETLARDADDPFLEDLEAIIEDCLMHLLALTLFCDPSHADRLTDLIRLLQNAIPLGERADAPMTWLVLTA